METEAVCAICSGALNRRRLEINVPDRFERHVGISETGYRRVWIECAVCGTATNVFESFSQDVLKDIETAYYEVDLAGVDISARFQKVMALPKGSSDNDFRVERVAHYASRWFKGASYSLVDIGAGLGVFLARLKERHSADLLRLMAIEPDPIAAAHLSAMGIFSVVNSVFPTQERIGQFDVVTLNKVLEHIADPVGFLSLVVSVMSAEKGIIYVEVPDVLTTGLRASTDNILGALHRHLYSPEGLAMTLVRAGLVPLTVDRIVEPSGKITVFAFGCVPGALKAWAEVEGK